MIPVQEVLELLTVTILNIDDDVIVSQYSLKSFYLHAFVTIEIMWCKVMCCALMQCSEWE